MSANAMNHKTTNAKTAPGEKIAILTAEEVSLRLRLPLSTVYYLAKTGALPGFQLGRSWRFRADELDRLACSRPVERPQILVVDDDAVTRELVKELLASRNFTVAEAGTVEQALAAVRERQFDLFLVDFKLPDGNGMEFIHQIRGDYSLTQVVVITAFSDLAEAEKLFDFGAMTLLRKPFSAGQFVECVDRILGQFLPQQHFNAGEKIARQNRKQPAINARLKQFPQLLKPIADADESRQS